MNLPNSITMSRIVMIPLCLWFLDRNTPRACFWAALIFTLAALSYIGIGIQPPASGRG